MTLSTTPRPTGPRPRAVEILGKLGVCLLGGALLWWIASHARPRPGSATGTGTAIVHVAEPDVVVSIDDLTYRVRYAHDAPIVCDLPAGEHRLTMTRGTTLLFAETFEIKGGEERILTAWRPPTEIDDGDEDAPGPGTAPQLASSPGAATPTKHAPVPAPAVSGPTLNPTRAPGRRPPLSSG